MDPAPVISPVISAATAFASLVFAHGGLQKVADPGRLEGVLASYGLIPGPVVGAARRALPLVELSTAVLLVLPATRVAGAFAAAALFLGYAFAMGVNLARGRTDIDCGCGGAPERIGWGKVARNLVLSAVLAATTLSPEPVAPSSMVIGWALALPAFLAWGALGQAMANADRIRADRETLLQGLLGAGL